MRFFGLVFLVGTATWVGCKSEADVAHFEPTTSIRIEVALVPMHPFLAEYKRELVVIHSGVRTARTELFPDTGGYSAVNLYRMPDGGLLIRTMGNDSYQIDKTGGLQSFPLRAQQPDETYLGAFDWCGRVWRFVPAAESPEVPVDQPHLRRACRAG